MKTRRSIWMLLSLLVALASYPWLTAVADEPPPGLKMEALAAFDGHFKYGEWLPVWVYLENSGADLDLEVRVRVSGNWGATTFAAPVPLPTGSRKRVPVYVLPNNFSRTLEVQLVDGEGRVLMAQNVDVKPQPNINFVVGLVAPERGALSLIAGASITGPTRPKVIVDVPLVELPERAEALASFDCLILNDVDTSTLTPEQKVALETWVRQGGRLVVGGGAAARRIAAGLPESLLPVIPRHEVEIERLPGLAYVGNGEQVRVPGPFLVSAGDLGTGRTLAAQGELALVRERALGDGYVDFVALDLAASPFDAWAGTLAFWSQLILANAIYPQGMPADVSPRQMRADQISYSLSNLPSLALPSVRGLSILLAVYIVLVGPINYLVLRWRQRLQWAWLTIPLITLLFSGGAFSLGYAMRGTDLILNKIAIISAQPDGVARVNTYVGLFSPARQAYEIEVRGPGLLSPLNPAYNPFGSGGSNPTGDMVFVQGNPGRVRGLAVNQWSMQTFMMEDVWPDFGRVVGDLRFEDGALVGTVRNETRQTLKDVVVVQGTQFARLGDLGPGAEAPVRLDMSELDSQLFGPPLSYRLFEKELNQPGPGGPSREVQLKQQILDNVLNYGGKFGPVSPVSSLAPMGSGVAQGLTLLAWLNEAPPEVRVADRAPAQQTTALLYTSLSYRLSEAGTVALPPGLIPGRITQMPAEGGTCGPPGVAAVYMGRGEAVIEFQVPESARDVRFDRLTLMIRSEGGWQQLPETALYNWGDAAWATLDQVVIGENEIADARDLIGDDGLVRVRLSTEGGSGGCFYLDLGFEGTR